MADQLDAARAEIESLETECDALDRIREHPREIAAQLSDQLREARAEVMQLRTERDEARARIAALGTCP